MNQIITLPNGRTAISFIPEDSTELAIVPFSVIQRLSKLLPKAQPIDIINDHITELKSASYAQDLNKAVELSKEFVDFHRTVNLIAEYKPLAPQPEGEYIDNR